ncbi:Probable cobalt transporter subunit (CbtB) [Halomicrobium zhouii]|uniref:Probable cobalt transporter subunit (CbtB) n=1 Tax=Halomicrobium zhouii TaxID=767519 RepID=A0A1I6LYZ1_9EURY|nr:CbtB domain-containing protein [Halomicrobium zhouii]SFS08689.1 Probable cobalt transporter subunit (CbtB) [Halomicrobium zhouii]
MAGDTDTVRRRIDHARATLTPAQMAVGVGLIAALGFTLLFVQDPLVHDGLHNIRHGAGVTCH